MGANQDSVLDADQACQIEIYDVYLVACRGPSETYVKIGLTYNLRRRISEIQTGCPLEITHPFSIPSKY
ncbi:GIY-YIG nuclease family protein [Xanthomonas campestris]|uniref:GIY-YIG nuclease family protein n=1 Tax=Xanthomonas campestris TaxID=339 RepID=UPI003CE592A2